MLKNNSKLNISKNFLFCICVICLMFTSFGLIAENSYAVDLDNDTAEIGVDSDITDQLVNSQDNQPLGVNNDDSEILTAQEHTVTGNTFADIQKTVNNAKDGDTIKLSGTYHSGDKYNPILISKKLTITGTSGTVLDGDGKSSIFRLLAGADGSSISNLKFYRADGPWGSAIRVGAKNVVVDNCIFENSRCDLGGVVATEYTLYDAENFIVQNCKFINNAGYRENFKEHSSAAALGAFAMNSQVINCYFDSNWVKGEWASYGGAIQVGLDELNYHGTVKDCTFVNNRAISIYAFSHGGAGCVRNGVDYISCTFINNTADEGGALTFHASGNVIDCVFINNTAERNFGGAISTGFLYDTMILTVQNCDFEGNKAPEGGAIQAIGLNVNIIDSDFKNNYATKYGGAINVQATNVRVENSFFEENWVDIDGGAIYIKGVDTVIKDSTFILNNATPHPDKINDGLGGAIYVNSTQSSISSNKFMLNTARNGSAIYHDGAAKDLNLKDNVFYQNQAWVYQLPISVKNIYYGDTEEIHVEIYGGNNIAKYDDLESSNAIYNAASNSEIEINGENPVYGATNSGKLYQDDREYHIDILLTVEHEDGTLIFNNTLQSNYLGEIDLDLNDLKPGKYYVNAKHFEDTYYKGITNVSSFNVYPKVDNQIRISTNSTEYNFEDIVVWKIEVTNKGPNDSTGVIVSEFLPDGLIYFMDTSGNKYDPKTGILNISTLDVGEELTFNIVTIVNKTGVITNDVNITANEFDVDLTNNYDDATINVKPAADVEVLKSVNKTNPNYHDIVNWTITVKNNGPDTAHNITVTDIVPKNLKILDYTGDYNLKTGTWSIDELENGQSIIFNIITLVDSTGLIENNVKAYAEEYDYDLSNNNDNERIIVDPASDLSIIKSVNATEVNYLDTVKWTLTITNNGPDDATGVKITDILPEGFTYLNSTWEYVDGEIDMGDLAVNQKIIIDIICKVETTGNYTNIANISGNEYDHNLTNNQDNQTITIPPAADLEIIKQVNESEPKYWDLITWTITVKNNGPDTAHNIIVNDLLPSSLIYVEDDSRDYNPATGQLMIALLDVGDEITFNIICKVNTTGLIVNDVTVKADEYDHNQTNNHDNESIEVEPAADVTISKIVNNNNPNYNDLVIWTIIVSNKGPDKATGVQVQEKIPEGLILINSTASKGNYDEGLWWVCCLEKDEIQTLEITCRVNRTGEIINNVTITSEEYDPNMTNNNANESIDVPPAVDIEVIHDVNNDSPLYGETFIWLIKVKNNGPDNATDVELNDILPNSLIFTGYNATKGEYRNNIWDIGSVEVGGVEYLNISCVANELGLIINEAESTSFEYDWKLSNNFDDARINVLPVTDLAVEKYVSNPTPNYGDVIKWTLKVSNNGPNDASNVKVFDKLPDGIKFIKSSDNSNYHDGCWFVGDLLNGQIKELEITCKVISTGLISNLVRVEGDYFDPNPDNNNDTELIIVPPASDLAITKIASKYNYVVGDVIEYFIEVVNNGPDTARNIKITEILDDLLKLKSFKVSMGKFDKSTLTWTIKNLGYGESARLYIKAVALGTGIIKNKVTVTSDTFDFDKSNNNDYAVVKVVKKNAPNTPKHDLMKNSKSILENHPTGNPFWMLVLSLVFSLIFLDSNISRKR